MNRFFYEEIGRVNNEIRSCQLDMKKAEGVIHAFNTIMDLAYMARNEGLLDLEGAAGKVESEYLRSLIQLIVDGTDSNVVSDIGWSEYFANNFASYDGLIHLLYLKGTLMIQNGERLLIVRKTLVSMLSEELKALIPEPQSESAMANDQDIVERIINAGEDKAPDEKDYSIVNQTGMVLLDLSDRVLSDILREWSETKLACIMKLMPRSVRKKIMGCISREKRIRVAETVDDLCLLRYREIQYYCEELLHLIVRWDEQIGSVCNDVERIKILLSISDDLTKYKQEQMKKYEGVAAIIDQIYHED